MRIRSKAFLALALASVLVLGVVAPAFALSTPSVHATAAQRAGAVANANKAIGSKYSQAYRMSPGYYDTGSLVYRCYYAAGYKRIGGQSPTVYQAPLAAQEYQYAPHKLASASQLVAGDLVFYGGSTNGRYKGIYHAAIYDGKGYVIHAKGRDYGVVKTSLKAFVGTRRVGTTLFLGSYR